MGETAKALGTPAAFMFRGQEYKLAPVTFEVEAQFEVWLERRAWEAAKRAARTLPPDEYQALKSQVSQDIAAGVYSWGNEATVKALRSAPGQKQLLYLMLQKGSPGQEITPQLVDDLYAEELDSVLRTLTEADNDPNRRAPGPAPGPGTS